jgi:hypothetical protein
MANQVTACTTTPTDIDISPIIAACNTPAKYTIVSYKNVTGVPTITSDKITFIPNNDDNKPSEIIYKVSCGILSAVGKVIITYINECMDVTCNPGFVCNKCTGDCEELQIDLSVNTSEITPEVNTSGFLT